MKRLGAGIGVLAACLVVSCSPRSVAKPVLPAPTLSAPVATTVLGAWTPPLRTKTTNCRSRGGLPDPDCTPGAVDARVTQASIGATICTRGYTRTVRPPEAVTERVKREQMAAYGLQGDRLATTELDHLLSRAEMIVSST